MWQQTVPSMRLTLNQVLADSTRRFDKGGEQFYDQISALHKSVRSSDADAALYWCTRMLDGGVDPAYLARRLTRMAIEDIGLADPRALQFALEAWDAFERLGSPEGELALAEVAIYLAIAAKSNAAYAAFGEVRKVIADTGTLDVPLHLRNAPTKLMKSLGYGRVLSVRPRRRRWHGRRPGMPSRCVGRARILSADRAWIGRKNWCETERDSRCAQTSAGKEIA